MIAKLHEIGWDTQGNLLLTGEERAERLAERLRQMGINPDEV
jgi:hypothetical protein